MAESESESGKVGLPTKEEVASLPHWAQVALAVRCARRVQPLLRVLWSEVPSSLLQRVEKTIVSIEKHSSEIWTKNDRPDDIPEKVSDLLNAVSCAAWAATAAISASAAIGTAKREGSAADAITDKTMESLQSAIDALKQWNVHSNVLDDVYGNVFNSAIQKAILAIERDFLLLQTAAEREQWTDETLIPPEFFGPLWPNGEPEGWPVKEIELDTEPVELVVELDVPDDADDEEVAERVRELVAQMDGMHRAMGGGGLKIAGVDVDIEAGIREGVPS